MKSRQLLVGQTHIFLSSPVALDILMQYVYSCSSARFVVDGHGSLRLRRTTRRNVIPKVSKYSREMISGNASRLSCYRHTAFAEKMALECFHSSRSSGN